MGTVNDTAKTVRQSLGIDTWGTDIMRLKRRVGEVIQTQQYDAELQSELYDIVEDHTQILYELMEEVRKLKVRTSTSPDSDPGLPDGV